MARIYELKINNFRGIKSFSENFNKEFICLIGRGDSGKTTILDAIAYVFSPNWDLHLYDCDFFNGKVGNPIEIEASVIDPPTELIREDKFGLYIRGLDSNGVIQDEITNNQNIILTIKLEVDRSLEPQWLVVDNRQEPKQISARDRAKFNVFQISDYINRHFYWSRGNPLYSILKEEQSIEGESNSVLVDAIRKTLNTLDQDSFNQFKNVIENIEENAEDIGINLDNLNTSVDFRDIYIKEGRASLHDGNVPLRLKGKGTKRLVSMAIQKVLVTSGGMVLVDEVEQGLEPDRVKNLVRTLKINNNGQIFITTHSSEVITELDADDLLLIKNDEGQANLTMLHLKDQNVIRACPEAFYAKKVIICEGYTEIGICRALDNYRRQRGKNCMSVCDCIYTIGQGKSFTERAIKLKNLGKKVCVFCDSDNDNQLNSSKNDLIENGIKVFDCEDGKSIEQQVFQDLPWDGVKKVIQYVIHDRNNNADGVKDSIKSKYNGNFPEHFMVSDTPEMRNAMSKASVSSKWFKRIDHGERLGEIIFHYLEAMNQKKLKEQLENLSKWIDE